jgi:hypothetical protein
MLNECPTLQQITLCLCADKVKRTGHEHNTVLNCVQTEDLREENNSPQFGQTHFTLQRGKLAVLFGF